MGRPVRRPACWFNNQHISPDVEGWNGIMGAETNITCWSFDATPANIILHPVTPKSPAPLRTLYLTPVYGLPTFPAEGNVRQNQKYGPTGVEYVGNFVVPSVGDVRLGVSYGANGTEYTGTLDPGSGSGAGGSWLRRR